MPDRPPLIEVEQAEAPRLAGLSAPPASDERQSHEVA